MFTVCDVPLLTVTETPETEPLANKKFGFHTRLGKVLKFTTKKGG